MSIPYYRKNLYVLSTAIFLAAMSWNQVIPFLPLFIKQMGVGDRLLQWTGIVFALQGAASIFSQPFWGKMGDKYGRKPMAVRAGLCLSGIYFGMAFCQTPLQLAIFRFLNGALTGFIPMSLALIGTNTPEEYAPRAMATAQSASAFGLIVGPALGGLLVSLMGGYRGSMLVSGTVVLISTLMVWFLVSEPNRSELAESTSLVQDFFVSLQSRVLSSVMLTVMVYGIYTASLAPVLALHLESLNGGLSDSLTGLMFSLPAIALVLTAHYWAGLGERIGFAQTIRIGLFGAGISGLALTFVHDVWVFGILFFLSGAFLAALSPSTSAIICTKVVEDFRGRAYGMQQSASMLGVLVAPLLATRIGDALGLPSVFAFVGLVALTGVAGFSSLARDWPAPDTKPPSLNTPQA